MSLFLGFDPARLRSVLKFALLLGVLAGLVSATLVTFTGEPLVRDAIGIEESRNATAAEVVGDHSPVEPDLISRSTQSGVGLFAALGLSGGAFGLVFGLAFWGLRHGRPDPFRRALVAGALLFGALSFAPWLKYPPNPPAVGSPDTLEQRQALYVSMIALALALGVAGFGLATRLRREGWPEHLRLSAVSLAVVAPFVVALAILPPAPDAVDAPATLIWRFRLASLGGNALLWTVLSVGFGLVAAEAARRRSEAPKPESAQLVPVN